MSLLDRMMTPCRIMDHITGDDPYGGIIDSYEPGATIQAVIRKDTTTEAQVAEKSGMSEFFTIVTNKRVRLHYHDVIRRESDGAIFRITSDSLDSEAPDASTVKITKATAERWVLPH